MKASKKKGSALARSTSTGVTTIDRIASDIERAGAVLRSCSRFEQARAVGAAMHTAEQGLRALGASLELQNAAAEKRLNAERWMGAFLKASLKRGNPKLRKDADSEGLDLKKLEITTKQSSRWQTLAAIPERQFVEHVVDVQQRGEKLTTGGAIAAASRAEGYDGDESYTPEAYIKSAIKVMGRIDTDPASCSHPEILGRIGAKYAFTKKDDGLSRSWVGNVWLNPPYSAEPIKAFVGKLLEELATNDGSRADIDQAIVLTNAATDTQWWHALAQASALVCIVSGRINFEQPHPKDRDELRETKSNRFAQSFFYFGDRAPAFREEFRQYGLVGSLRST